MHRTRVRNDGDETKRTLAVIVIERLDQRPISWICADNAIRLRLLEELNERLLHPHEAAPVREPRRVIQHLEYAAPELGRVTHRAKISFLGEGVEPLIAKLVEVGDRHLGVGGREFQRFAHVAGGGIVPVTESRRKN